MTLFTRGGAAFAGTPLYDGKKRPYFTRPKMCWRCGGAGGSEAWRHTGWTCYQCGGNRTVGTETVKLYTAEKLASLDAIAAKRFAKKKAAADAAAAVKAAETEARAEDFKAMFGKLLDSAEPYRSRSSFVDDVIRKAWERMEISDKAATALADAIARFASEDLAKAASRYVGKEGERLTAKVTVERHVGVDTMYGTLNIVTMRTAEGNTLVSKGRFYAEKGEALTIKATVKEHAEYRGEKQTVVQRVKIVEDHLLIEGAA